jgi:multimeric flavodoxin WrbA
MKVIAINGSTRKNGNTALLIKMVFNTLTKEAIDCELLQLGSHTIKGCSGCNTCRKKKDRQCVISDDEVNNYVKKLIEADGILLGSPTYLGNITANMKALVERLARVAKANNSLFKYKVGASVVAARRAGGIHAFNSLNQFFLLTDMIVVGSCYWNIGIGNEIGDVENDTDARIIMETLGENMAYILKKLS